MKVFSVASMLMVSVAAWPIAVHAQSSTPAVPASTAAPGAVQLAQADTPIQPEQTPVAAPTTEATSQVGLADIIVTATKRNENLQRVPVSITAITSEQLAAKGVFNTADLNNSTPNLQVSSAYGEAQPNFTIRGIGVGTEYNSNAASPVGIYVDEVYQSFRASHGQQLYDLDQVEIVRGPQGTLFGRNTTGGAINFISRKPLLTGQNGYVTAGYGSFNRRNVEGAVEFTPVDDRLGIRIAGNYVDSDPYVRNRVPAGTLIKSSPNVPDSVAFGTRATGIDPGGAENFGFRGQVRFKPVDTVDLNLKGYYAKSNGGQDSPQSVGNQLTSDTITLQRAGLGPLYNVPAIAPFLPPPYSRSARGIGFREIEGNSIGTARIETWGAVLNAKIALSDSFNLTSITGYDRTHLGLLPFIDCDGTPYDVCAIGYESRSRSFNQDLRLDYGSGPFKAIVGAYYGYDKIVTNNRPDFLGFLSDVNAAIGNPKTYFNPGGLVNPAGFPTRLFATQDYTQVRKSAAIYGEGSYEVTPKLKLTGGLRYTKDKFGYVNALTTYFDDTGAARLYTVSDYKLNGQNANYLIGVSQGAVGRFNRHDKSSQLTGRAIADYRFTDVIFGYASYSHGYRGGTYNGLAFQSTNQVYFVQPETVNAYEVGLKTRFLDNRLQFNVSAFHYDYSKQQNQIIDPSSVTFLINLDGKLTGMEAELTFAATHRLRLNASIGALHSTYDHGQCPAAPITGFPPQAGNCLSTGGGNVDVGGNPFPYASKFSANLGADWKALDLGAGALNLHVDSSYTGRFKYDTFGSYDYVGTSGSSVNSGRGPLKFGEGNYWVLNGRIAYSTSRYTLAAYVKNATNKLYFPNAINVESSYASDYIVRAAPRQFGGEATFKF
ncbi:TonB-dependent receptor [Sphingomonas faeni]|uniref:TonB-dependent receptor n=1 Tax=Sphingomonas faeni TaxID=185950 RepID=UPI003364A7A2